MLPLGRHRLRRSLFAFLLFVFSGLLLISRNCLRIDRPQEDPPSTTPEPYYFDFDSIKFLEGTAAPCNQSRPLLLAIIHSSPSHVPHRKAIRQTWGSFAEGPTSVRTLFVVGRSKSKKISQKVLREAKEHGDLVLVQYMDSYKLLTLKHLAGIRWALRNCPEAPFLMKADDDAFVDIKRAVSLLLDILGPKSPSGDVIACRIMPIGTAPHRSGKYQVTQKEYPLQEYPEYCSGLAYFARPSAMAKIHEAATSRRVPYLWIDDIFVTGLAAGVAGISHVDLGVWFARTEHDVIQWMIDQSNRPLPWMVSEMSPRHWPVDAIRLWNKTKNSWIRTDNEVT
ncbi:beta-1,3-galactosyltransferase 5-like [Stegodyphus dumicola]|uniref:beta-1,3-galactosyltransferase 5-like n=1 Tax=Stegodyphus dumicola TaxID=202533 RepID=UPI0015AB5A21|nr:beta-1,3-galactosyltransferase 5-like [Stegodyphus dumicola]